MCYKIANSDISFSSYFHQRFMYESWKMKVFTLLAVLFLFFVFCVVHVCESCPEGQFQSSSSGLCCKLCPAGTFMSKECTVASSNDTQCKPCPSFEYSHTANHWKSCIKCTLGCTDKKILVSYCNSTMDTWCVCPFGSFWDNHLLMCTKCTKCAQGERLVTPCTKHKDAKCEACAKGTYLKSATQCVLCDHCKKGEMVVKECTKRQNTRCKWVEPCPSVPVQLWKPNMFISTPRPPTLKHTTSRIKTVNATQQPREVPREVPYQSAVVWVLLAVVIILLLVILYLLIERYSKRRQKTSGKNTYCKSSVPKDAVVTSGSTEVIIKENNFKFSRTPADVIEKLAFYLNGQNGKSWKHLAGLMSYTSNYTQNWELTPTDATQKLLQDWQQRSDATVFKLYSYLKELRRDDAAAVLLPFLTGQASECEPV